MKTISLETSKRLAPYLEDVETEYGYHNLNKGISLDNYRLERCGQYVFPEKNIDYKTLTLEEAIEFLPKIHPKYNDYYLRMMIYKGRWCVEYGMCEPCDTMSVVNGENLLEAIEKMLIYLLDNNLLGKK